jgi:hypothetical protein
MKFIIILSAMVRSITGDSVLESWLDKKLKRRTFQASSVPTFISEDPEFRRPESARDMLFDNLPPPPDDPEEVVSGSVSTGAGSQSTAQSALQAAGLNYWDLPKETLELDGTL